MLKVQKIGTFLQKPHLYFRPSIIRLARIIIILLKTNKQNK